MAAISNSSKSKKKYKCALKWCLNGLGVLLPPANSHFSSSLDHVGGERLFVFESVTGHDLLDGDIGSCEEPHQPNQADDDVLDGHQRRQALCVKRYDLEDGRKDQRQETAADRADQ